MLRRYDVSMARESPIVRIERLFESGDAAAALAAADELLRVLPNSFLGHLTRARANARLGNHVAAEQDVTRALAISPNDPQARLLRSNMDLRLGRIDDAIACMTPLARGRGPIAVEAHLNLLMALHQAGRTDAFLEEAAMDGPWRADPRARLMLARVVAIKDRDAGVRELVEVFRDPTHPALRRSAGFEAIGMLDKLGRYREAFDLATEVHRATSGRYDPQEWIAPLEQLIARLEKGPGFFKPRVAQVEGVAFVVSLPRSGTTLLEQMLDRHPAIGGIGEYDGIDFICRSLHNGGPWPRVPAAVPDATFHALQRHYLEGATQIRKSGATWSFDKSLGTWRALPELAAVLPGAVCINVDRDPRDVATSIFLSFFNPASYEWAQQFDSIRRIIELERRIVPLAFEVLGLAHERIVYEDLVEQPALFAARCLKRMGLEMDEAVLTPEQNTKTAFTLSFAQVRQPINKRSIARWKNYDWAFDSSWDSVVAEHESRRTVK
jgi:tetratricopeptide (TPR) repeat protein